MRLQRDFQIPYRFHFLFYPNTNESYAANEAWKSRIVAELPIDTLTESVINRLRLGLTLGSPAGVAAENETYFVRPFLGYKQVYSHDLKPWQPGAATVEISMSRAHVISNCNPLVEGFKLSCTINTSLHHAYPACTDHADGSDNGFPVKMLNEL